MWNELVDTWLVFHKVMDQIKPGLTYSQLWRIPAIDFKINYQ